VLPRSVSRSVLQSVSRSVLRRDAEKRGKRKTHKKRMTTVLFLRHSVRNVPDTVTLANGETVPLQNFSCQKLPLYAEPVNNKEDGGLSGVGWNLSHKLGQYIKKRYKNISIRGNVGTGRTIDTAIAIARGADVENITVYNGAIDPLIDLIKFYHYTLPPSSLEERKDRYERVLPLVLNTKEVVEKTFHRPLPLQTGFNEIGYTGLLQIENVLSQEPTFSALSSIDLEIKVKDRKPICRGIVLRQYVDNIPLYTQQLSSNMAEFIVNFLNKKDKKTQVIIVNDNYISSLAALLSFKFKGRELPTQFVNANSGLIFSLSNDTVTVDFLSLDFSSHFSVSPVVGNQSLSSFTTYVKERINYNYVDLSPINNVKIERVA
jgi:hypothetical protein